VPFRAKHPNVGQHHGGCVAAKAFANRCQFEAAARPSQSPIVLMSFTNPSMSAILNLDVLQTRRGEFLSQPAGN
jgi:hypothetical protein